MDEEEIEARCAVLRKQLTAAGGAAGPKKNLKMHMVHELADAKMKESERLRVALKIGKDYEEGGHWRRQEERAKQHLAGPGPVEEGEAGRGKARRDWDGPPPRRERGGRERSRSPPPARERGGEREERERGGERRTETTSRRERSYSRSVSRSRSRSRSPDERSRPVAEERRGGGRRERSYSRSRSRSMSRSRSRSRSVERRVSRERDRGGRRY